MSACDAGIGVGVGVGVNVGVGVGVAVGVGVEVGVGEMVGVGETVGVGVVVGVGEGGGGVGVNVGVGVAGGVGVGVTPHGSVEGPWTAIVIGAPVLKKPIVAFVVTGGLVESKRKLYNVPQRKAFAFWFCAKVSEDQFTSLTV